ncbi:hypothetical protein IU449_12130 [Nocardia higoensis]|uniref:Secreted protein n=1 Tax=Nocardia higoensis TaxID=228599 RepID=A0ABS0D9Z6_9NOCA|nr:hypothetical protein [Nocardia higoensis]MBF6355282.1 hypothetical protein [Nocardia higoensis]
MKQHSSSHPARNAATVAAVAAVALATLAGTGTATGEPLRLEYPASTSTPSGSGNAATGSVDTTGSTEGDPFVGSAVMAWIIDDPSLLIRLPVWWVTCHLQSASGDETCWGNGRL